MTPDFCSHAKRMENHEALIEILDKVFLTRTRDEWARILPRYNIIWTIVKTPAEVAADPTAWADGYFQEIDHPVAGKLKAILPPWQFSQTPPQIRRTAPELGQHTEEVLVDLLGYTWDELAALKEKKVISIGTVPGPGP